MANKKTLFQVEQDLDRWHRKLTMAVRKIDELRALRKKMLTGKIKTPFSEEKFPVVKFESKAKLTRGDYERIKDDLNDIIPSSL